MRKLRLSEKRQSCIDRITLRELRLMEIELEEELVLAEMRLLGDKLEAELVQKPKPELVNDDSLVEVNTAGLKPRPCLK
jgi:hypothetical protein